MARLIEVRGKMPNFHPSCFLAEDALIAGDVEIGKESSIWFKAVLRGDVCKIRIGERVNVQDGSIIHGSFGLSDTIIKNDVSIGHGAILHGCIIESNVLIGMNAVILDNAYIEENVIVAAGAVVKNNAHLESGYVYGGVTAKKIKKLDQEMIDHYIHNIAQSYIKYSSWYQI